MTSLTILKGNKSYLEAYFRRYGIKVAEYTGRPGTGVCGQQVLAMSTDISPTLQAYIDYYKYCYDKILSTFHIRPMTELEKIDKRLLLFKEYLRYYLSAEYPLHLDLGELPVSPKDVMELFNRTGWMFTTHEQYTLNFDGWLLHNGYKELSELKSFPMYAMGVDPYEKGNFEYNSEGMVVWVKDQNGRWRMVI